MAAAEKTPQDIDAKFTGPIETDGTYPTYVTLNGSAELLGTRKPVKVAGTIDGHEFNATLMPSGQGPHWLPVKQALKKTVGKDPGEQVTVHLRQRLS
jgi:hypothetical protein